MTKYSAADFANAQFAEHPSGGRGHRVADDVWRLGDSITKFSTGQMAREGWVPVIPARTIHDSDVEALCADTASYERDDYLDGFMRGFQQAGGVILEDPEPTNTDRLEQIIRESEFTVSDFLGWPAYDSFAKYLNTAGVTAPNVKGN